MLNSSPGASGVRPQPQPAFTATITVSMPIPVIMELNGVVGARERSRFIVEAVRRALADLPKTAETAEGAAEASA